MISPDFRNPEPIPLLDAYKLYVSQNHGKPLILSLVIRGFVVEGFGRRVPKSACHQKRSMLGARSQIRP